MKVYRDGTYPTIRFRHYHMMVQAARIDEPFGAVGLDGIVEYGQAGDWLVRSPTGEYYPMCSKTFEELYALL